MRHKTGYRTISGTCFRKMEKTNIDKKNKIDKANKILQDFYKEIEENNRLVESENLSDEEKMAIFMKFIKESNCKVKDDNNNE